MMIIMSGVGKLLEQFAYHKTSRALYSIRNNQWPASRVGSAASDQTAAAAKRTR
jgi:hypothetical protein